MGPRQEASPLSGLQELCPAARQLQQPDRVPGGSGVEQHVVESGHESRVVRQQSGELVKGRDLGGARTRQLLGDRAIADSGNKQRTGPTMRSRYAVAACSGGSISKADSPGTAGISVTVLPIATPNTCPTLDAGSVDTKRTFLPAWAKATADAYAIEVLPTHLPVKKKTNRGGSVRNRCSGKKVMGGHNLFRITGGQSVVSSSPTAWRAALGRAGV